MIKYYVECDHFHGADIMGSTSARALCHDDLGKKYEMPISPEENARLADGQKLYKRILMTVDYAHQNAIKKITDAGGTVADIPMSLFYDPTAQASQTVPQAITTQDTAETVSKSLEIAGLSPERSENSVKDTTDSSASVEATTSLPADIPASALTGDEQEPAPETRLRAPPLFRPMHRPRPRWTHRTPLKQFHETFRVLPTPRLSSLPNSQISHPPKRSPRKT